MMLAWLHACKQKIVVIMQNVHACMHVLYIYQFIHCIHACMHKVLQCM